MPLFPVSQLLSSFESGANIAIIGASGGIGSTFVRLLASDPGVRRVEAVARTPIISGAAKVASLECDIRYEPSLVGALQTIPEPDRQLDIVIVATGILHDGTRLRPEKRLADIDAQAMADVMAINTIGPAVVAKHYLPRLRRDEKSVFAALSARVGSISDNRLGGWASYRASKAALNMLLRTFSIEHARTHPESVIVALHPGTVATRLSAPFQKRVPDGKLFSPEKSVTHLLSVIDGLDASASGGFYAWDGKPIEY